MYYATQLFEKHKKYMNCTLHNEIANFDGDTQDGKSSNNSSMKNTEFESEDNGNNSRNSFTKKTS